MIENQLDRNMPNEFETEVIENIGIPNIRRTSLESPKLGS